MGVDRAALAAPEDGARASVALEGRSLVGSTTVPAVPSALVAERAIPEVAQHGRLLALGRRAKPRREAKPEPEHVQQPKPEPEPEPEQRAGDGAGAGSKNKNNRKQKTKQKNRKNKDKKKMEEERRCIE